MGMRFSRTRAGAASADAAEPSVETRAAKRARDDADAATAAAAAKPARRGQKKARMAKAGAAAEDAAAADAADAAGAPPPLGAMPMGLASVVDDGLLCPICSEVLTKPVSAVGGCAHAFCKDCLAGWISRGAATCPVCRAAVAGVAPAKAVEAQLAATRVTCTCGTLVRLSSARAHAAKCAHAAAVAAATAAALQRGGVVAGVGPAAEALAAAGPDAAGPNRSTFACPLCAPGAPEALHLDCAALVAHVQERHAGDARPAVCPVCAAMPWGDASYVSQRFAAHVALRHRFEYGTFTTYEEDDDAILRRVLEESAREAGGAAEAAAGGGAQSDS